MFSLFLAKYLGLSSRFSSQITGRGYLMLSHPYLGYSQNASSINLRNQHEIRLCVYIYIRIVHKGQRSAQHTSSTPGCCNLAGYLGPDLLAKKMFETLYSDKNQVPEVQA